MKKLTLLALALTVGLSGAANAATDLGAELEALKAQVQQQQVELQQLRAQSSSSWMNERRSEEVKALIQDVLADADTRAAMAEGGISAGHNGKNFFLASEDGSFLLKVAGQIQMRYTANFRDEGTIDPNISPPQTFDSGEFGFEVRRAKLDFSGHIADPRIQYRIQIEVDEATNNVRGDIITIGYQLTDSLYIWAGEDKAPFLREELISSKHQLAAERSYVNELFTLGVAQGVGLNFQLNEDILIRSMISDGARSGEEPDSSGGMSNLFEQIMISSDGYGVASGESKAFHEDGADIGIGTRIDWTLEGNPAQAQDFTAFPGEDMLIHLGGAVYHEVAETGDAEGSSGSGVSTANMNDSYFVWTLDASIEYQGLSAFIAYVQMDTDYESKTTVSRPDFDPWGLVLQAAYNMDVGQWGQLEPFVRWEHVDLDSVAAVVPGSGLEDEIDLLTFGVNWYHKQHDSKFTLDIVWAFDPIPAGNPGSLDIGGTSGTGLLADFDNQDDQIVLRAQYQLLF